MTTQNKRVQIINNHGWNRNNRPLPIGEGAIKAESVLNAWLSYCRQSRLYRIFEFFGLR